MTASVPRTSGRKFRSGRWDKIAHRETLTQASLTAGKELQAGMERGMRGICSTRSGISDQMSVSATTPVHGLIRENVHSLSAEANVCFHEEFL
jgi:hypothetical protein